MENKPPDSPSRKILAAGPLVAVLVLFAALSLAASQPTLANYGADGGDLLAAVLTGGVPHPTGYPTYVLLGMLFQRIPVGSPYFRGALLSVLPAALAAGLLAAGLMGAWLGLFPHPQPLSLRGREVYAVAIPAILAGLAWGLSPLLLSQAVIVEVHGLQALFAVLALGWAWLLLQRPAGGAQGALLAALALLYGLGLGNHLTLLLFLPAIAAGFWCAWRGGFPARWIWVQVGALLLGTLVYLYLPLSARRYPPVNWGNPQTWQGFLWVVSGKPYQGYFLSTPADLAGRLIAWFSLLRQQYGLPGLVLGAAGAVVTSQEDRRLGRLLLWGFLSYSVLVLVYHTADASVYLLPATMAWAVWMGFSLRAAWRGRWQALPWGKMLCLAFFLYLLVRFPTVYRQVDPRSDSRLSAFSQALLDAAPPGALVLTQSDPDTFSLWYDHFGLGQRPDIAVMATSLASFRWYQETLIHTYPDLSLPEPSQDGDVQWVEKAVQLNSGRPICRTRIDSQEPLSISFDCDL